MPLNTKKVIESFKFGKDVLAATIRYPKLKLFIDELIYTIQEKDKQIQNAQTYIEEVLITLGDVIPDIMEAQNEIKELKIKVKELEKRNE